MIIWKKKIDKPLAKLTKNKKEESRLKRKVEKGWNQVNEIFSGGKDCKFYTGFTEEEFDTILVYCTHICEYDKETGWIKATETNGIFFPYNFEMFINDQKESDKSPIYDLIDISTTYDSKTYFNFKRRAIKHVFLLCLQITIY